MEKDEREKDGEFNEVRKGAGTSARPRSSVCDEIRSDAEGQARGWTETPRRKTRENGRRRKTGPDRPVKTQSRRGDDTSERWTVSSGLAVPRASNQMTERSLTPSRLLMAPVVRTPLRHQRVHLLMKGRPPSVGC